MFHVEHPISQQQVAALRVGQQLTITSGLGTVTVLHLGRLHATRDGAYAWRNAVLLLDPEVSSRAFSVHRIMYQDDVPAPGKVTLGQWVAEDGTAARTLPGALGYLAEREDAG
jgi:hypothetical protein